MAVIGLGKIGLPLAVQFASMGSKVIGCDVNPEVVRIINSGTPTFMGEPGLAGKLKEQVSAGRLIATLETSTAVEKSDVILVVVPLLVNASGQPIFDLIDSATEEIGKGMQPGSLVLFETTLPVGTTRERFVPILERNSGLSAGSDFFVAFSPERVYTGNVFQNLQDYPKLVGGLEETSARKAADFYSNSLTFSPRGDLSRPNGVWDLGSLEAAELAKLAETTYRDVNIALANQFALYSESVGIDVYKVIEACNSQPFSHIHQPGVAVGGHCIPVYPHMYLSGDPSATVVRAAREANESMPMRVVQRLEDLLGSFEGRTIAVLGLAYRGGVKEHAFSGAWSLVAEIKERGGVALVHDPLWSKTELEFLGLSVYDFGTHCDAAIVQANHQEYKSLGDSELPGVRVVVDGRNWIQDWGSVTGVKITLGDS